MRPELSFSVKRNIIKCAEARSAGGGQETKNYSVTERSKQLSDYTIN